MEIRVLGCQGSQRPGYGLTGFLMDTDTLLDAGTVTSVMTLEEQLRIDQILFTHAHPDPIREIASLADKLCYCGREAPVKVIITPALIDTLKRHII
jgi:ribonuclease BN (tRNA processing enzyme)